ncbi:hypothetical protein EAT51_07885 [Pseudoxanthomonas winnipegensis]|uniref:hypothetical protein n=1 Tax=Pseudoxanthomonas winnipegensis TaxID=2480810 RepID=UPI00102DA050|nr:hypothetical protein [Pseudoxanthomonas winnipegensis]RZZ81954.1 hypothetical protein EA662_17440 [Pseudoxanthomonas winnipegensis]TAA42180.1 hypothetical protein EAT51_07885 [Pseudoxanthomonas winnipegensis]
MSRSAQPAVPVIDSLVSQALGAAAAARLPPDLARRVALALAAAAQPAANADPSPSAEDLDHYASRRGLASSLTGFLDEQAQHDREADFLLASIAQAIDDDDERAHALCRIGMGWIASCARERERFHRVISAACQVVMREEGAQA